MSAEWLTKPAQNITVVYLVQNLFYSYIILYIRVIVYLFKTFKKPAGEIESTKTRKATIVNVQITLNSTWELQD